MGIHLATSWASRSAGSAQDESLRSVDLALPMEFEWYPSPVGTRDSEVKELSLFAGPRAVFQTIDDNRNRESESGTLLAILLGVKGRLGYLSLTGELNLAWTPDMTLGGIRSEPGFIVLPMLGAKVLIPLGGE